ncbi:uncharacterized protein LOC129536644 isoform X3 [Moschus berezovskii]|uniref:uncharacterized protein LOC129536644 isoform X3 n=1 Tax=Moschus berezovskii TaxID=68408 RepID=UPI002444234B|nr:uncharacterized protein LOC129536644 isoform X3 [Moschus berezovskii]
MARTWLGAVASPPLPKGSLASTLRALDHSRAELSSTRSTSPRGPGQGRQPGPLRGPQCPGMAQGRPLLSLTKLPCHPQSCPGEPWPGFSCLRAGQHHAASAGTCTRGPGGGGLVRAGPGREQCPVLPCCPAGWASASGGQRGNWTQSWTNSTPLCTQSQFLQLPLRSEVGPFWAFLGTNDPPPLSPAPRHRSL